MHYENQSPLHSDEYPGAGPGHVKASYYQQIHPLQEAWSASYRKAFNGKSGFSMVANAIDKNGERSHTGVTYIEPALERLTILQGQVRKILFDGNRAIGVDSTSGEVYGTEVILCAGTFGSAKILELSGIGHGDNVPSWLNLPVGENLQDHPNFSISIETEDYLIPDPKDRDPKEGGTYNFIYHSLGKESLSGLQIDDHFLRKIVFDPDESSATLALIKGNRYPENKGKFFSIIIMYSYPLSRGTSKVVSEDATEHPRIEFQYFSENTDIELFARHVLEVDKLLEGPLKQYNKPEGRRYPSYEPNLASVKEALKQYVYTNYHPCGTCSMMARDRGGVVDQNLKVYGTQALRVCDASIIPLIPRANIISTVYAIADKTADIILAEHSK